MVATVLLSVLPAELQPSFVLDGSTMLSIGAMGGTLIGAISILFRLLIASKDAQIATLTTSTERQIAAAKEANDARIAQLLASTDRQIAAAQKEVESQRAVMMAEIQALKIDRDYFRGLALGKVPDRRRDAAG